MFLDEGQRRLFDLKDKYVKAFFITPNIVTNDVEIVLLKHVP